MIYASDRLFTRPGAGKEFLIRRIGRVAPLYWASTTAVLCLMLLGSRGWSGLPGFGYILSSYLFIPNDAFGSVDGIAFPLLSLGWTLNYEMLFYAVFSAFLFLPRVKAVVCVAATLLVVVMLGQIFEPGSVVLRTWSQPIILEFAFGMVIGTAFLQGVKLPPIYSLALIGLAVAWIGLDPAGLAPLKQTPNDMRRLVGWGLPAVMVLASLILTAWRMPPFIEKPAILLGDASYSLYLTHPFVLVFLEHAWPRLFGVHYLPVMVLTGIGMAIVLAVLVHRLIERPCDTAIKHVRSKSPQQRLAIGT